MSNSDLLIFKTQADRKSWAKPDAYEAWEKGQITGDENVATENLRRFFEQHFHENNDSMLHRLPPTEPGRKPTLNSLQPDLHPLEVLFDVEKLVDIGNDQPLSAAFVKIDQAAGLYDHWLDAQGTPPIDEEQWAQHAVQSVVWDAIGCSELASIEESIVLAFTQAGTEDHNRITMFLNRSYRKARQGLYSEALALLLQPNVWRGLTINDYTAWAQEIWHILVLRATRRGQDRHFREFLLPRRPPGDYNPRDYFHDEESAQGNKIRDPIYEVIQMRHCDQAPSAVDQLLKALWHSEFLTRFGEYRTGIILLADVSIEFRLPERSQRILEEVMPQIINGSDLEQRAFACFTLARSIIAASSSSTATGLQESLPYLTIAEGDYRKLGITTSLMHVQYLLSVVYHNLGMPQQRDAAAGRHLVTLELQRKEDAVVVEDDTQRILEVVELVGAHLAGRYSS
ncbi:hypothetical protein C0992_001847 [Termitomyces sp. T32_za158]|nr:hypothetical protein C0992_001847 [Termitomyces sp. T32_za158]